MTTNTYHTPNKKIIFLKPGEYFWGNKTHQITTILGSCVAVCLWHSKQKIGCMYHIVMPGKRIKKRGEYNTRYGDDVFFSIMEHIENNKTAPRDYVVKIFGGSFFNIPPSLATHSIQVGTSNIQSTMKRLEQYGFSLHVQDTGGTVSRKIIFELWSGAVNIKRISSKK